MLSEIITLRVFGYMVKNSKGIEDAQMRYIAIRI